MATASSKPKKKPAAKKAVKHASKKEERTQIKAAPKKPAPPASAKATSGKKAAAPAQPAVEHKLRIRVRAYEHKILDLSVKQIIDTASRFDATVVGPVPLPTEIKRWTVNRSSFVYKDSREQ